MGDLRLSDKYQLRQKKKAKKKRKMRILLITATSAALVCAGVLLCTIGPFAYKEPALPANAPVMDSRMMGVAQPTQVVLEQVTPAPTAEPDPIPLLVNASNPLPEEYVPEDLVALAQYCDPDLVSVEPATLMGVRVAADKLMEMISAAKA